MEYSNLIKMCSQVKYMDGEKCNFSCLCSYQMKYEVMRKEHIKILKSARWKRI